MTNNYEGIVHCIHTAAAASVSGNQAVTWMEANHSNNNNNNNNHDNNNEPFMIVYTSHALLHILCTYQHTGVTETTRQIVQTLRTSFLEQTIESAADICITCVCSCYHCHHNQNYGTIDTTTTLLVSAFSNGRIHVWEQQGPDVWKEHNVIVPLEATEGRSITCIAATTKDDTIWIAAGTSSGAILYQCVYPSEERSSGSSSSCTERSIQLQSQHNILTNGAIASFLFWNDLLLVGTAAPRYNKIHVYNLCANNCHPIIEWVGSLLGHENWITCLTMSPDNASYNFLASSSQDFRIRLWKFQPKRTTDPNPDRASESCHLHHNSMSANCENIIIDNNDDDDDDDDDYERTDVDRHEEGESRMEIQLQDQYDTILSVTLEALLYGHEESVTSVVWHPNPQPYYGTQHILISSSMDRSILLWAESKESIWTPICRVGCAGGILGGPIGASLLGFCSVSVEPVHGRTLVGHGYGGTLHIWNLAAREMDHTDKESHRTTARTTTSSTTVEDRAAQVTWNAAPCVTGHFRAVTDLCWEASRGEYLLTVSNDQTCRLWAPLHRNDRDRSVWVELARPQVHGYNLSAVASLSSRQHPHRMLSGADEKEIRVFDAPLWTVRMLKLASGGNDSNDNEDAIDRVERAFIPSLGLSNKATAADAAEEDGEYIRSEHYESSGGMVLPLERDLGAESIWPEVQKLFGHNTEIYCLASLLEARTGDGSRDQAESTMCNDTLVASSCKAREVEDASIRLWNVEEGKCLQVMQGGHKSTVASMSFSFDGCWLASAGKDRRLCVWKRDTVEGRSSFSLACVKDSAHKRIIWSVHFCPFDATLLASGSRDGSVKIWKIRHESEQESGAVEITELYNFTPSFKRKEKADAVTALSFAPVQIGQYAILALGLESGRIEFWKILTQTGDDASGPHMMCTDLALSFCHVAAVTKLAWRPLEANNMSKPLYLASSSMDWSCRILELMII